MIKHDLEGLEIIDIARQLSITKFGVYARLYKGRKELASAVRRLRRRRPGDMKRRDPELDPELEAFLQHRARSSDACPPSSGPARSPAGERPSRGEEASPAAPLLRCRRRRRCASRAVVVCFGSRWRHRSRSRALRSARWPRATSERADAPTASPERPLPAPGVSVTHVNSPSTESAAATAAPAVPTAPPRPARFAPKVDPFSAELDLLQRAHAAYTRRDFSAALALVAEHARRFPRGHLAEQREALHVRSLVGSGRTDEAHRAEAAFAIQFPRSVLLPRVAGGTESAKR